MLNSINYEMEGENYIELAIRFNPKRKLSERDADLQICRDLFAKHQKWNDMMAVTYQKN